VNVAAGYAQACQTIDIDVGHWSRRRKYPLPDLRALSAVREGELNDESKSSQKRTVNRVLEVCRENS
jgi:hypothetical protein